MSNVLLLAIQIKTIKDKTLWFFTSRLRVPKSIIIIFFSQLTAHNYIWAQPGNLQQLKQQLQQIEQQKDYLKDTLYASTVNKLAFIYAINYPDSAISLLSGQPERCRAIGYKHGEIDAYKILGNAFKIKGDFVKALDFYNQSYQLAQKIKYEKAMPGILNNIGLIYMNQGDYTAALDKFYASLKIAENTGDQFVIGSILNNIANVYFFQGKMEEAETNYKKMLAIAENMADTVGIILAYNNIGEVNLEQNNPTKALQNLTTGYKLALVLKDAERLAATTKNLGKVYFALDSVSKAINYFDTAINLSKKQGNLMASCKALLELAKAQNKKKMLQPALANGLEALRLAQKMGQAQLLRDANETVSTTYEALGENGKALQHYQQFKIYSDSLKSIAGERAAANYKASYEFSKKELDFQRQTLQQRWIIFSAFAGLLSLGLLAFIVNRNRKKLNRANLALQQTNQAIKAEKLNVEEALTQLKAAQARLIHAEKMASLGELTAGIAHEIQNPLNFVNNFSELNKELLSEMKAEIESGNLDDVKAIANDIAANEEKINLHGKRADAIVKGMLQHSRTSTDKKEPTDINALCGECLRLSYHGLRAADPSFSADFKTDFDGSIGKIKLIPQDFGRLMLNLYNNAFYAVKDKQTVLLASGQPYHPTVSVSTKKIDGAVWIQVKDNGSGIPQKVLDKIFQPFFTTKPTGQGTGLGLSLSYDIVKVHEGEITVHTQEGEGTEFAIHLPIVL